MNLERLNFERLNFEQPNFERLNLERLNLDYDPTSDILNDESERRRANLKKLVNYIYVFIPFENFSVI